MAKEKTNPAAAAAEVAPTAAQLASAVKSVMAIIGCGQIDALTRLKGLPASRVIQIASLEDANKRKEVVTLLYS
jgi:threonine dehydrogenase-like Zn-dependent dehydrogenase